MQKKQQKICSFTQNNYRLQLIKIVEIYSLEEYGQKYSWSLGNVINNKWHHEKFQVRLNRRIIDTSISEYRMRKVFATYCQNIVLQLKIY